MKMRARNIKPGFFLNEYLSACSPHARLLFIGLWMLADREGRLEYRPKQIGASIFPYEKGLDVEKLLGELENVQGDHPFIIRYQVEGKSYIQVVNFKKHQQPNPKEKASELPPPPPPSPSPFTEKNISSTEKNVSGTEKISTGDNLLSESTEKIFSLLNTESPFTESYGEASPKGEAPASRCPSSPPENQKIAQKRRPPPAVEAYKKAFFIYPRRNLFALINEKVGQDDEALRLWYQACISWSAHGWNPKNISGLLEYFQSRAFLQETVPRGIPLLSEGARIAIELAEKYKREEENAHGKKNGNGAEESEPGGPAIAEALSSSPFSSSS